MYDEGMFLRKTSSFPKINLLKIAGRFVLTGLIYLFIFVVSRICIPLVAIRPVHTCGFVSDILYRLHVFDRTWTNGILFSWFFQLTIAYIIVWAAIALKEKKRK